MNRVLVLTVALAVAEAACSPRTEEPILGGFFNASRLRDRTALQKLATTMFDPAVDGIITSFHLTGVVTRDDAGRAIKDVSISAPVKMPGGYTIHKNLVVTLECVDSGGGGRPQRWMVTAVREAAADRATPPR